MKTTKTNVEYRELARARVAETRSIVVSSYSKGGFTIAQQLEAKENDKTTAVFMKGAFHIEDIQGLYDLRDAINLAIKVSEERDSAEARDAWDEELSEELSNEVDDYDGSWGD